MKQNAIQIFDNKKVRTVWDEDQERLAKEGSQSYENIVQLKMKAPNEKKIK